MFAPTVSPSAPSPVAESDRPLWAEGLNQAQHDAVVHDGPALLVVAGAGSGKTRTLASRVARLIEDGTPPDRILLLTFTRRAAREMLHRATGLAGPGAGRVVGGTFHSTAHQLLQRFGRAVGLEAGFTVLDQGDSVDLLGVLRSERGLGESGSRFPKKETIGAIYSRVVNAQLPLGDVLKASFPWCIDAGPELKELFAAYTVRKREQQVVDYDDLLLYWRALARSESMGSTVRGLFDHVLVDEYQDTNQVQADVLYAMCDPEGAHLTVVGDDAQAIYSFRAASTANMAAFTDHYSDARVVLLEENYRSTPQILDPSNLIIAAAAGLRPKTLRPTRPAGEPAQLVTCEDESAQSNMVCDQILERRELGIDLRDQAVLFRASHHADALELELSRRNIPFVKFGGLKFLEAAHIKDLLALLRMLDNPRDQLAWHRVLSMIDGVGPATTRRLIEAIGLDDPTTAPGSLERFLGADSGGLGVPARAATGVDELRDALVHCRGHGTNVLPTSAQIDRLRGFCSTSFERRYDNPAVRLEDLDHLAALAGDEPDRGRFLANVLLEPPSSSSDLAGAPMLDDDYLNLSTIHSAKGGEWKAVYLIHAADGNMPSDMALGDKEGLEEERRLMYVALTRARDHLTVSFPLRYHIQRYGGDGAHTYAPMSRFLTPVTDAFDERSAGHGTGGELTAEMPLGADPVAVELDQLWEL